ncbi:mucin-2-like isoform X4 [Clytia hemisphaerica]|uniref:mucin-2-like isoform X4 n=1 Tax=Clytia hemisphaerica TaxID=252671 RepID=UPI0034D6CB44
MTPHFSHKASKCKMPRNRGRTDTLARPGGRFREMVNMNGNTLPTTTTVTTTYRPRICLTNSGSSTFTPLGLPPMVARTLAHPLPRPPPHQVGLPSNITQTQREQTRQVGLPSISTSTTQTHREQTRQVGLPSISTSITQTHREQTRQVGLPSISTSTTQTHREQTRQVGLPSISTSTPQTQREQTRQVGLPSISTSTFANPNVGMSTYQSGTSVYTSTTSTNQLVSTPSAAAVYTSTAPQLHMLPAQPITNSSILNQNSFEQNLESCINSVTDVRRMAAQPEPRSKTSKKRKRPGRGPDISTVKFKFYHLPVGSSIPRFSAKKDGYFEKLFLDHKNDGYGFPGVCWNFNKNVYKDSSLSLDLTESQFSDTLQQLFPKLQGQIPNFFKLSTNRQAQHVTVKKPTCLKESGYSGIYLVTTMTEIPRNSNGAGTSSSSSHQISVSTNINQILPTAGSLSSNSNNVISANPIITNTASTQQSEASLSHIQLLSQQINNPPTPRPLVMSSSQSARPSTNTTNTTTQSPVTFSDSEDEDDNQNSARFPELQTVRSVRNFFISRANILMYVLPQYINDSILDDGLNVEFDGEPAIDFEGLTKDMFTSVWRSVKDKYMCGDNLKRFVVTPGNIPTKEELEALGRVLQHGVTLQRFVPIFINEAQLYMVLTTEIPTDQMVLKTFLSCFSERESDILKHAIDATIFDPKMKDSLMSILTSFQIRGLPEPKDFKKFLFDIGYVEIIIKPYFFLRNISRKIWSINEKTFVDRIQCLKPTGEKLVKAIINGEPSDPHEDRVLDFLKRFFYDLDAEKSGTITRFITGMEVLNDETFINVEFNGEINVNLMFPKSNPCGNTLHLSRYYLTFEHLSDSVNTIINDPSSWKDFTSR